MIQSPTRWTCSPFLRARHSFIPQRIKVTNSQGKATTKQVPERVHKSGELPLLFCVPSSSGDRPPPLLLGAQSNSRAHHAPVVLRTLTGAEVALKHRDNELLPPLLHCRHSENKATPSEPCYLGSLGAASSLLEGNPRKSEATARATAGG